MKKLKSDLETMAKDIGKLQKKAEQMLKRVESIEKRQTAKDKNAVLISKKQTATGLVYSIIKRSRKGVAPTTIEEKTGFDEKKVYNCVNLLKRKGMVKNAGRGLYVKA